MPPDTHNINAALNTILLNNGITNIKKVTLNTRENKIEFIDQSNRRISAKLTIKKKKEQESKLYRAINLLEN